MSYQSPIKIIMSDMNTHIQNASLEKEMNIENTILEAIEKVGVVIDKDELIRAIRYDRDQYQKGYDDRDAEIVRCKDCKYWLPMNRFHQDYHPGRGECELNCWVRDSDWFCADGERKG